MDTIEFTGSWDDLLPKIEKAVKENNVLNIVLPPSEYLRLVGGGMEDLKRRLSQLAASMLYLSDSYPLTDNKPTLVVLRFGRCPH